MKTILSEDEVMSALSQSEFIQKTNFMYVIGGILLLLLGVVGIYVSGACCASNGTMQMLVMVLGICVIVAGLVVYLKRHYSVYAPTGSKIQKKSIYLSEQEARKVVDALRRGSAYDTLSFAPATTNQYRFDIMGTVDRQYAHVQVLHYVPFNYEPFSPVYLMTEADAVAIWQAVLQK